MAIAAENGDPKAVRMLLENDADMAAETRGFTALGIALKKGYTSVVNVFMDYQRTEREIAAKARELDEKLRSGHSTRDEPESGTRRRLHDDSSSDERWGCLHEFPPGTRDRPGQKSR